jgi:hypothetical protein
MKSDKVKGPHGKATAATSGAYEPVECPSGGPKQQCETLNAWGEAWRQWGEEVRDALDALSGGTPTGVSPPPKPPYSP